MKYKLKFDSLNIENSFCFKVDHYSHYRKHIPYFNDIEKPKLFSFIKVLIALKIVHKNMDIYAGNSKDYKLVINE